MRIRTGLVAHLVLLCALALARPARGNGRFPAAQHVLVGPGPAARTIALRATFGFVVSDDGGGSFHYVCEEAVGYGGEDFDPAFALTSAGELHVGLPDGLARLSADRCGSPREPLFEGLLVDDLDNDPAGARVLVAAGPPTPGTPGRIYRSDDGGQSYRALGEGPADATFATLEGAPSDPTRVYATAVRGRPREAVFLRSDDGGATLRELPLPLADTGEGAFIAAVDPTRADTVYLRVPLTPTVGADGGGLRGTALLRSTDGGQSWREIARSRGAMLGFAISDDGRTLWYGGPNAADRLQRSDDGGESFRAVNTDVQVLCLRQHAGTLYVCADYTANGYALARSRDGGGTLEPLVRFGEVAGAFACPADSHEAQCGPRWSALRDRFFSGAATTSDGGVGLDGGRLDAGDAGGDAGGQHRGCAAQRTAPRGVASSAVLVALAVLSLARRRRRRARSTPRVIARTLALTLALAGCGDPHDGADADAHDALAATDAATRDGLADAAPTTDATNAPTLPLRALVDPAAPDHPPGMTGVIVREAVVVLSPRLFLARSAQTGKCLFATWVALPAGGDYAALEVIDRFIPSTPDGGCEGAPGNVIPADVAAGDVLNGLRGLYGVACPRDTECPAGAPATLEVSAGSSVFVVGAHGAALPSPASVAISDIAGEGATLPPRALALQGALVTLAGTALAEAPAAAATSALVRQDGAASIPVDLSRYAGAQCQRAELAQRGAGAALGALTGVLMFDAGRWVIQPRAASDVPALGCAATY